MGITCAEENQTVHNNKKLIQKVLCQLIYKQLYYRFLYQFLALIPYFLLFIRRVFIKYFINLLFLNLIGSLGHEIWTIRVGRTYCNSAYE